jgi:predicted acylesterase/phospholipase RssA
MTIETPIDNPFGKIALCMSGGGYRAAAFHLGTLKMLSEIGWLPEVKFLSTASGGTILAAKFALTKIESNNFSDGETTFETFFNDFCRFLKEVDVVNTSLQNLYTPESLGNCGDLSLIRSAANVYDEKLFLKEDRNSPGQTFEVLLNEVDRINRTPHFCDLIFNATEFQHGNSFRFRAKDSRIDDQTVVLGNNKHILDREAAKKLRLADIVAASSCFPGAFEPIRFPEDFVFEDENLRKKPCQDERVKSIPLMDGGIYDNQGIDSLILSYRDPKKDLPFQLIIVSDTCQRDDDFLPYPVVPRKGFLTLQSIWWLVSIFFFILALSWLAFLGKIIGVWNQDAASKEIFWNSFLYTIFPFFLETIALGTFLYVFLKLLLPNRTIEIAGEDFPIWSYIKGITKNDLWTLFDNRLKSAKAMTFEVFMKRIRTQTVNMAKANPRFSSLLAFNYIYDLNVYYLEDKHKLDILPKARRIITGDPELAPSEKLRDLAIRAEKVSTALWFDKEKPQQVDDLIECGRISGYFSLLKYLQEHFADQLKDPNSNHSICYHQLKKIWGGLKK